MRRATFDALDIFPIILDPPMAATLACNRIRIGDLIAQAQAAFLEETGKTITTAQAIELLDQEIEFSQEEHYWENEPLRTVTIRGIDGQGYPQTTRLELTFDGSTFSMTEYRDGIDVDGWNLAHSLAEVNDQLELAAEACRSLYRMRKEARAKNRTRKTAHRSKPTPQPELAAATA